MNAGIEITKGGRIYTCWIGGEDGPEAYMLLTYSDDCGETFKEIQFVIDPHSDDLPYSLNTHVGGLWLDPKERLWLFYQQSFGMWDGAGAVFAMVCDEPDAENPIWSAPRLITPGAVIKKPIILSNGEWLLPVSIWERWHISKPLTACHHEYDDIRGANVYVSNDEGNTWQYRGGVIFENSSFNEHSVVELSNGNLLMISRCDGVIKKSYSSDFGKTWSAEEEYFKHVSEWSSMATLRKLASGNLLLIKHGVTMDDVTAKRSHLSAFISKDDGKSWQGGLLLDEREGVSYPDVCQGQDGTIYVQYDYKREQKAQLLFARFREEDVLCGKAELEGSALCKLITSHSGITGTPYTLFDGAAKDFKYGDGSADNPYIISSAEDFTYLAKRVYDGEKFKGVYFAQSEDIDFRDAEIVPVGAFYHAFSGTYDGNGHHLKNFKITGAHICERAPFGSVYEGIIKNVRVKCAKINGKGSIAAIVGNALGTKRHPVTIENCVAEDSVNISAYLNVGGIVGISRGFVEIKNCTNYACITIPRTTEGKKIFAGGIVGCANNTTIKNCENHGDINARYSNEICVGGIAGGEKVSVISYCKNSGNILLDTVLGNAFIGGIGGRYEADTKITACENSGKLTARNTKYIHTAEDINYFY